MRFYRISAAVLSTSEVKTEYAQEENAEKLSFIYEAFYHSHNERSFWFISDINGSSLTGGYLTKDEESSLTAQDLSAFETIEAEEPILEEIRSVQFGELLYTAQRNGYIHNEEEIIALFSLRSIWSKTGGFLDDERFYSEALVAEDVTRSGLEAGCRKSLWNDSLLPELGRIYQGKTDCELRGHPVHYLFC